MCIAMPGRIVSINGYDALVDIMGVEVTAFVGLLENPGEGDNILIHAGCAIQVIDEEHFFYLENVFSSILEEV